jgi:hypothetical protein
MRKGGKTVSPDPGARAKIQGALDSANSALEPIALRGQS